MRSRMAPILRLSANFLFLALAAVPAVAQTMPTVEFDEAVPRRELPFECWPVALEHGRAQPGMHTAVELDQLDLHVNRAGELGVRGTKPAQFGHFARLDAPWAGTLLVHGRFWPERFGGGKRRVAPPRCHGPCKRRI